jgi:hypothetical protein
VTDDERDIHRMRLLRSTGVVPALGDWYQKARAGCLLGMASDADQKLYEAIGEFLKQSAESPT